ncbi:MAG: magnesium transporter [Patescibacteria group bacterium]|nr:magnesium transporter [Patescibacteria group bacterium]
MNTETNTQWEEKNKNITRATLSQRPEVNLEITKTKALQEIKRRTPWIFLSVLAGIAMIWISQSYEQMFLKKMELVFFIPMIVYISDSIGTETLALFIRELALKRVSLKKLALKEILVGLSLGIMSGVPMGLFSYFRFHDLKLSTAVSMAMIINGVIAVFLGIAIPFIFFKLKKDPALGTDEITTIISDNLSLLVYLITSTIIIF